MKRLAGVTGTVKVREVPDLRNAIGKLSKQSSLYVGKLLRTGLVMDERIY